MSTPDSPATTQAFPLADYLGECDFVQVGDARIQDLAARLRADATRGGVLGVGTPDGATGGGAPGGEASDVEFARRAFEFVRDEVAHSFDADDPRVTVTALEVLEQGVGLCYAKSILLAAVLRAGGVPTALCYQWLGEGEVFMLHGLVAVHLDGAWHRQDARGNKPAAGGKPGVDAQFSLAAERLAWPVDPATGERDLPELHVSPPQNLVDLLRSVDDIRELAKLGLDVLPDATA